MKDHGRSDDRDEIVESNSDEGRPVDIRTDDDKLIVNLSPESERSLYEFLAGTTKDNIHPEVETGIPISRELL